MSNKITKYIASIYLASIGDRIGFGNGQLEKNYSTGVIMTDKSDWENSVEALSCYLYFRFISEGGVLGINMSSLRISDDTLMHIGTLVGLIDNYTNREDLYNKVCDNYVSGLSDIDFARESLLAGTQTIEAIKTINSGVGWRKFSYSKTAGGNGGLMRTMGIGLAFSHTNNLLKLIESSIMISSITHPNCTSFIGSIVSALFTSYAIHGINPETWIFNLIKLLESDTINNIIEKIKPTFLEYFAEDKKSYLNKLLTYVETSFQEYNYIISDKSTRSMYPFRRNMYYFEKFSTNKHIVYPGAGADDCIIIAYDCLLMSKNNYERLIYTAMINIGDSDTIGSVASAWYGALYGFENVPSNLITGEEYYKESEMLGQRMYEKYNEKTINEF